MKKLIFTIALSLIALPLIYSMNLNENLLMAVKDTKPKKVVKALCSGANVNTQDDMDMTPLHVATSHINYIVIPYIDWSIKQYNSRLKVAKLLLNAGADLNVYNADGETPLDLAIKKDNTEIADLITSYSKLLQQIVLNPTNQLLTQAINLGWVYAVKLLLKAGIKPELHDLALVKQKHMKSSDKFDKNTYATIGCMLLQHLRLTGTLQASKHKLNAIKKFYYQAMSLSQTAHLSTTKYIYGPISKSGLGLPEDISHTIASFTH